MEPTNSQIPQDTPPSHTSKTLRNNVLLFAVILVIIGAAYGIYSISSPENTNVNSPTQLTDTDDSSEDNSPITTFDECVAAGNPVAESMPEQCSADGQTFTNTSAPVDSGFSTVVLSGKKAFSMIVPDGWSIIKPLDTDSFFVMGTEQPTITVGKEPVVEEPKTFGTDAPAVFSIVLLDEYVDMPKGESEAIVLADPAVGKSLKYSYTYEVDENAEDVLIGEPRKKGDKQYTYVLRYSDGTTILATYSVYGEDATDNSATVDRVIQSVNTSGII